MRKLIIILSLGLFFGCGKAESDRIYTFVSCVEDLTDSECEREQNRTPQSIDNKSLVEENNKSLVEKNVAICIKANFRKKEGLLTSGGPCPFDPLALGRKGLIEDIKADYREQVSLIKPFLPPKFNETKGTIYHELVDFVNNNVSWKVREHFLRLTLKEKIEAGGL